jgi:hypothetical protein
MQLAYHFLWQTMLWYQIVNNLDHQSFSFLYQRKDAKFELRVFGDVFAAFTAFKCGNMTFFLIPLILRAHLLLSFLSACYRAAFTASIPTMKSTLTCAKTTR